MTLVGRAADAPTVAPAKPAQASTRCSSPARRGSHERRCGRCCSPGCEPAARRRRYGSVCTGAFLLAAGRPAGRPPGHHPLGRRGALAEPFRQSRVEVDAIHVRDGKLRTAAGVTAGLDLALALVEEDLGREIARRVASQLVMFFKRARRPAAVQPPRGSARSAARRCRRCNAGWPPIRRGPRRGALGRRAGMSPRHFARLFRPRSA